MSLNSKVYSVIVDMMKNHELRKTQRFHMFPGSWVIDKAGHIDASDFIIYYRTNVDGNAKHQSINRARQRALNKIACALLAKVQ